MYAETNGWLTWISWYGNSQSSTNVVMTANVCFLASSNSGKAIGACVFNMAHTRAEES